MRIGTPLLTTMIGLALAASTLTAPPAGATTVPSPMRAQAVTIAGGGSHAVVLGADGVAYGTGYNGNGQLTGTGNRATLTRMAGLPSGIRATAVAAGAGFSLVLGSHGVVYGAGSNTYGQLTGTGDRTTLAPLTGLPPGVRATAIAAGTHHSLVRGSDGVVYGTGYNGSGALTGAGDRSSLTPLTGLPAGIKATAIAAGGFHSLVRGSDGVVYGTGNNGSGQLTGTGNRSSLTALAGLPGGISATAVASGSHHSLVLGSDRLVYGTGYNGNGQLTGTGDRTTLARLTGLPSSIKLHAVAAGSDHTLVLDSAGTVYGTGSNLSGQLTGTDGVQRLSRVSGPNGTGVEIAGGSSFSLVRARDGLVNGTGSNAYGQLTGGAQRDILTRLSGQRITSIGKPRITGTKKVRRSLKASQGSWSPGPSAYAYQWYRGSKKIGKATASRYRLRSADKGKKIRVKVTARRAGVATATRYSSYTTRIR